MSIIQHSPIILASSSPIRRALLEKVGISFDVVKPTIEENALKPALTHLPIPSQALELAKAKAMSISGQYPDHIIIGSDQICELQGHILHKPGSHANAIEQLLHMQHKTHWQHSAVCIIKNNRVVWQYVDSNELTMKHLSKADIEAYLTMDTPYQCCGSYRLEGHGKHLFHDIKGDFDSIQGLPLTPLLTTLHQQHIIALA